MTKPQGTRFEHRNIRMGNVKTGREFIIRCHKCPNTETWMTNKPMPDEPVARHYRNKGWVVAKHKDWDICPECAGSKPENIFASVFKATKNGEPITPADQIADAAAALRREQLEKTFSVIERHLPPAKPEKPASEAAKPLPEPIEPAPVAPMLHPEDIERLITAVNGMTSAIDGLNWKISREMDNMVAAISLLAEEQAKGLAALAAAMASVPEARAKREFGAMRDMAMPEGDNDAEPAPAPKQKKRRARGNAVWTPDDIYVPDEGEPTAITPQLRAVK